MWWSHRSCFDGSPLEIVCLTFHCILLLTVFEFHNEGVQLVFSCSQLQVFIIFVQLVMIVSEDLSTDSFKLRFWSHLYSLR